MNTVSVETGRNVFIDVSDLNVNVIHKKDEEVPKTYLLSRFSRLFNLITMMKIRFKIT